MKFDVLKVVITKNSTFWSVTPCSFVTNQMAKHPILEQKPCAFYMQLQCTYHLTSPRRCRVASSPAVY